MITIRKRQVIFTCRFFFIIYQNNKVKNVIIYNFNKNFNLHLIIVDKRQKASIIYLNKKAYVK